MAGERSRVSGLRLSREGGVLESCGHVNIDNGDFHYCTVCL